MGTAGVRGCGWSARTKSSLNFNWLVPASRSEVASMACTACYRSFFTSAMSCPQRLNPPPIPRVMNRSALYGILPRLAGFGMPCDTTSGGRKMELSLQKVPKHSTPLRRRQEHILVGTPMHPLDRFHIDDCHLPSKTGSWPCRLIVVAQATEAV